MSEAFAAVKVNSLKDFARNLSPATELSYAMIPNRRICWPLVMNALGRGLFVERLFRPRYGFYAGGSV